MNGDGRDELIVGAGTGKPGLVRIFSDIDLDGKVFDNQTDSFFAFSSGFTGGVTVAAGNTTNSFGDEVVMGMASKGQQVRIRTDADRDRRRLGLASARDVHELPELVQERRQRGRGPGRERRRQRGRGDHGTRRR